MPTPDPLPSITPSRPAPLSAREASRSAWGWVLTRARSTFLATQVKGRWFSAAYSGNADALDEMLRAGMDPNLMGERGTSALALAAISGHTRCARLLLEAGAAPSARRADGLGRHPAHHAALSGKEDCLAALLPLSPIHARDESGSSLLHCAAYARSEACVALLCAAGLDPMARDGRGQIPLQVCIGRQGSLGAISRLAQGVDRWALLTAASQVGLGSPEALMLDGRRLALRDQERLIRALPAPEALAPARRARTL